MSLKRFSTRAGVGTLLLGALGCSAELEQYTADADTGSTHAFISVQRSMNAESAQSPRSEAFAGFLRVPVDVDSRPLFELLGLRRERPAVGQCRIARSDSATSPIPSTVARVELLEAGDVLLGASGRETSLAPHAFPSVTDSISGVVYTTRDRSATLPAGSAYLVRTTGGPSVPVLNVNRDAPAELESITVGGVPLADIAELSTSQPADLTWAVGTPGDLVYAELGSADGTATAVCAFRDESGAGTIPAGTLGATGPGRLSVHRVRSNAFVAPGVDAGEVAFDFEVVATLNLAP